MTKLVQRAYWLLAIFAFAVLACAAVWMGALNQDEGWYLYAANLVAEGQSPYADFAYTQGPVMPVVYGAFAWVWRNFGLLGARVFTLAFGVFGIVFAAASAKRYAPPERGNLAALVVTLLLGCNLYHLYYLAIPKTYALAGLFVAIAAYLLSFRRSHCDLAAGLTLAFAAGTRFSLGMLLAAFGVWLLVNFKTRRWAFVWFGIGGVLGLALAYAPCLMDEAHRQGLSAAIGYHSARGGSDLTWFVGSLSRLVRWYLPVFIVLGMGNFRSVRFLLASFLAVFAVQMLAPFPYEDYQVPVMSLLAVFAAVNFVQGDRVRHEFAGLLVVGLAFAGSFGSPLLEKWMTNGQDRFWSRKKAKCELAQLRDVARRIEAADPGGTELFTQDLYLAIETNRKVPKGLEMGPFARLTDDEWKSLIENTTAPIAALSGYAFAIRPPECDERPVAQQREFRGLVRRRYALIGTERDFGQNATTLEILKRK